MNIKLILLFITCIFQQHLVGQTEISDTSFISRNISIGIYQAVFIENHPSSIYYNWICDFSFDDSDSLSYQESMNAIFKDTLPKFSKPNLSADLNRNWCGLETYKNNYYLYAPSDWGNNSNLLITDSTIVEYFMDGPYAYVIERFKRINETTFEFDVRSAYSTTNKITIYEIDKKYQVAIVDKQENDMHEYKLLVNKTFARHFPIIVNYCKNQKMREFQFDTPDYLKLLGISK